MLNKSIVFVTFFLLFANFGSSIKFEVKTGEGRCLKNQFRKDALVKGEISITPEAPDLVLNIKVSNYLHVRGSDFILR
jgi:hypothetical protein